MQVETAEPRTVENCLRQDQPVGDDDRGIGLVRAKRLGRLGRA